MSYDETQQQLDAENEWRIACKIIEDALALGYEITVRDGSEGDVVLTASTDAEAIKAVMRTTGEDVLFFAKSDYANRRFRNWVWLIWGNGCDVISDCSDNEATREILAGAEALAEELDV